ncbi:MAG: hypothetical protein MUF49_22735 [Oculatellaceae cyanobacterium Prado106]|jgi:hypothetical protein|nr:hypothetical protein [Oculatellaceae cyanobacterium Prado106]
MTTSAVAKKITNLAQIAQELHQGKDYTITRLTSLKSLCKDTQAAGQFCLYLVELTLQRMQQEKPDYVDDETWLHDQSLLNDAIPLIGAYLAEPTQEREQNLRGLLCKAKEVNNQYKNHSWGPIRIIQSKAALLVENALHTIFNSASSSYWGYQVAKDYAERYSPRYPNSLTPDSAPLVEDIANFWSQYHFHKPLQEWLQNPKP